jgi:hypothetical protein
MTWAKPIDADLAWSLVVGLGADCPTAARLARDSRAGRVRHRRLQSSRFASGCDPARHDGFCRPGLGEPPPIAAEGLDQVKSYLGLHPSSTALPRCERAYRMTAWRRPS